MRFPVFFPRWYSYSAKPIFIPVNDYFQVGICFLEPVQIIFIHYFRHAVAMWPRRNIIILEYILTKFQILCLYYFHYALSLCCDSISFSNISMAISWYISGTLGAFLQNQ